ncbi:hypothetical protein [Paenibacillus apiarius]|uniref:hypothetical protein n=1 Tax=Paenibacillus apiarius TaxID=46240 RepID=UPI001981760D|nr:hypothetical protein [Paenibacillus apiarius]MBN3526524.1 hypothetical protein [Paenibacillus apiarius]
MNSKIAAKSIALVILASALGAQLSMPAQAQLVQENAAVPNSAAQRLDVRSVTGIITEMKDDPNGRVVTVTSDSGAKTSLIIDKDTRIRDAATKRTALGSSILIGKGLKITAEYAPLLTEARILNSGKAKFIAVTADDPAHHLTLNGIVEKVNDNAIYMRGERYMAVKVTDQTAIVNANGQAVALDSIKEGAELTIDHGPRMMVTFPGTVTADRIVVKAKYSHTDGTIAELLKGSEASNGSMSMKISHDNSTTAIDDIMYLLNDHVVIMTEQGKRLTMDELKPGMNVTIYHGLFMTKSFPAAAGVKLLLVKS